MRRYIPAGRLEGDARLRLFPEGHCQWCGKPLPRRCKWYCPGEPVRYYAGSKRTYLYRRCYAHFYEYWYTTPRYRRLILLRDKFTCQQCGRRPTAKGAGGIVRPDLSMLHVDHITPLARGGADAFDNLQLLCAPCNLTKGAKVS